MFADLGHFGAGPVRFGWLALAYPCLILNYVGQAAHVLAPEGRADYSKLFYLTVPTDLLWPMIMLATLATMIASQALISGAFSLISQAISLDLFPAVRVLHTSKSEEGQIYVPIVNYTLMVVTILLVIAFQRSEAFAHAYGVAVTAVIVLTCVMSTVVMMLRVRRRKWLCTRDFAVWRGDAVHRGQLFRDQHRQVRFGRLGHGADGRSRGGVDVHVACGRAWVKEARMITGVLDLEQFIDLHVGEHAHGLVRPPDRIGVFMSSQFDAVPIEFVRYSHFANSLPEIVIFLTSRAARRALLPAHASLPDQVYRPQDSDLLGDDQVWLCRAAPRHSRRAARERAVPRDRPSASQVERDKRRRGGQCGVLRRQVAHRTESEARVSASHGGVALQVAAESAGEHCRALAIATRFDDRNCIRDAYLRMNTRKLHR
jgi:hypothetical protein